MTDDFDESWGTATRGVRAGTHRTPEGEHSNAIYMTSSFVFDSADAAAARFAGDEPGNIYSRFTNPTVDAFSKRLAAMEGGECCVATASGMSAILATCLATLSIDRTRLSRRPCSHNPESSPDHLSGPSDSSTP